jgi:hypothetical protein
MKSLLLIFTMALTTTACAAEFNPDLSNVGETGNGTEGDSGNDTDADTGSSSTPDMGGGTSGDGDGDTGSTDDTGEDPYCGDGIANGGEPCDGEDMGGHTCVTEGGTGGEISCRDNCTLNVDLCTTGFCPDQPEADDFSACEVDGQNAETCGDPELYCVDENQNGGFCSRQCDDHLDCILDVGYAGCGAQRCHWPEGGQLGRCVIECNVDDECPSPMTCQWSEVFGGNTLICM